jgi:uncharacterized protein (TIGR02466 family)
MVKSFSPHIAFGSGATQTPLTRHALFPTDIWQARMPQFAGELIRWANEVERMREASPVPAGRTNRSGWNSQDNAILDQPCFTALAAEIRRLVAGVIAEMAGAPWPFVLQSWANLHDRGGFNFSHIHDNVLLSGSFYIRVPTGSGPLVFRDPRPGVVHSPYKGNGANAFKEVRLAPSAGLLVLFPHWLEHYVEPHDSDETRIAIAINALSA